MPRYLLKHYRGGLAPHHPVPQWWAHLPVSFGVPRPCGFRQAWPSRVRAPRVRSAAPAVTAATRGGFMA
jgi:hypothetical protein